MAVHISPKLLRWLGKETQTTTKLSARKLICAERRMEMKRDGMRAIWMREQQRLETILTGNGKKNNGSGQPVHIRDHTTKQITQELAPSQLVRRWSVRSQVVIEAKAEDNGKQLACKAAHPALRRTPTPTLQTSVTLSVLHPAGVPVISGYRTGEILRAGERRTLSCRSRGGNPRPSLTWFRNGRVMDDASARDAAGTINTLELAVTAKEDGAVYECRVRNDVLEKPLAANVTLTVYYPSSYVSLAGPAHVKVGEPISLTCETAESNPPSSLTWVVQGEVVQGVKERVSRVSSGGWVTSSELTKYVVRSRRISEVVVECRALNPAIDRVVKKTSIIDITQPPGPPVLEGDIHAEVVAGSTISLACTSKGGRPRPVIRIYKKDKLLPTELMRGVGVTRARSEVVVTPADNGVRVTCEVSSPATTAPLATSTTLAVFCKEMGYVKGLQFMLGCLGSARTS
ncbi:nephrin-like [Penaeus chinensis]|uniref:nephrin-like n=1 Tax=Penaeus chinensis TaxID=139456 RepID=UPI001FB78DD2|nr:nephrin-like [Penaeus chinensis]